MTDVRASTPILLNAAGATLSGLYAAPAGPPRALIVALHGGGVRASYFDDRAEPGASLLELAARLGYAAVALDRPGYGAARALPPEQLTLACQVPVLLDAVERARREYGEGEGVFLVGHSFGMMTSVAMAAEDPGPWLLGVSVSGAGYRYRPHMWPKEREARQDGPAAAEPGDVGTEVPAGRSFRHPPEKPRWWVSRAAAAALELSPVAAAEGRDAFLWTDLMPQIAARVRVPVQYIMPEHDQFWVVDERHLRAGGAMFKAAPFVETRLQPFSSHAVSIHSVARAYHLRVLSFLEECIVYRKGPTQG